METFFFFFPGEGMISEEERESGREIKYIPTIGGVLVYIVGSLFFSYVFHRPPYGPFGR